jgi:hypothetical protein
VYREKKLPTDISFYRTVVHDDSRVRCKTCDKNFPISHEEENDITRHADAGPILKTNVIRKNTNKLMAYFAMTKLHPNTDKVTAAECIKVQVQ